MGILLSCTFHQEWAAPKAYNNTLSSYEQFRLTLPVIDLLTIQGLVRPFLLGQTFVMWHALHTKAAWETGMALDPENRQGDMGIS